MLTRNLTLYRKLEKFKAGLCITRESTYQLYMARKEFLHRDELAKANEFQYEKKRNDFLLGRRASKAAIGCLFSNYSPFELNVGSGVFGQPIIFEPKPLGLNVSISHTDDVGAALAFPEAHPMGIDIETINPNVISAIADQLTKKESTIMSTLSLDRSVVCTAIWSIKEALGKAIKCGMTLPADILEISSVEQMDKGILLAEFTHFIQYRSISYVLDDHVCTIVFPRKSEIQLDLNNENCIEMSNSRLSERVAQYG